MNYLEIQILQDGIDHLSKAIDCFADSDLVSQEEFDMLEQFIDEYIDINNKAIDQYNNKVKKDIEELLI